MDNSKLIKKYSSLIRDLKTSSYTSITDHIKNNSLTGKYKIEKMEHDSNYTIMSRDRFSLSFEVRYFSFLWSILKFKKVFKTKFVTAARDDIEFSVYIFYSRSDAEITAKEILKELSI